MILILIILIITPRLYQGKSIFQIWTGDCIFMAFANDLIHENDAYIKYCVLIS